MAFEYIYRQNVSSRPISDQGLLQFKNTYRLAATALEIVFYYINVEEMEMASGNLLSGYISV